LVKRESGSGLRSSVYSVSSSSVGAVTTLLVVNTRNNNPVTARTNTGSPVEGRKAMLDIYNNTEVFETRLHEFVTLVDEYYGDWSFDIHNRYGSTYVGLLAEHKPAEALELLLGMQDPTNSL
jgi:hypothetical protein